MFQIIPSQLRHKADRAVGLSIKSLRQGLQRRGGGHQFSGPTPLPCCTLCCTDVQFTNFVHKLLANIALGEHIKYTVRIVDMYSTGGQTVVYIYVLAHCTYYSPVFCFAFSCMCCTCCLFVPQSNQSAGPICFLIFCSISISLLTSLVAGRRPQRNAGADQLGMYSTIPVHWNIKSAPASLGRSRVGPAFYIFSFLNLYTTRVPTLHLCCTD